MIPAGGIRRWKAVKWTVEYRSPLAGEDMPRKPLDSLEAANAPGIAGGCRPKAVKHPPGVPSGERCINRCAPDNWGTMSERTRPSADAGPAGRPGGVRRKAVGRRPPAGRLPAGLTGFVPTTPPLWGWGGGLKP